jgi:hypothetical protein
MPESKPEIKIEKRIVAHDEMARHIMSRYTFKTSQDTKEFLFIAPKLANTNSMEMQL